MVIFNELRIAENRSCLTVDCYIEELTTYANMYIESIYIDYYKNTTPASMPGAKAYCLYENTEGDTSVRAVRRSLHEYTLPLTQFGIDKFDDGIFYVIVKCNGTLPASEIADLPCGADNTTTVGVIIDWKTVYEKGMQYVSSIYGPCASGCADLTGFEHFALLWNALRLAISVCDWQMVENLWNKILLSPSVASSGSSSSSSSPCGCR